MHRNLRLLGSQLNLRVSQGNVMTQRLCIVTDADVGISADAAHVE